MTITTWQIEAMQVAAEAGGQYLDELGTSDLAHMDETDWMIFIETVCAAYQAEWQKQRDSGEPPF